MSLITILSGKKALRARIFLRVLVPVVLLLLPADFFDRGTSLCLSRLLFNTSCPACGLTRGCMHLIHLDFEGAFAANMASFVALPVVSAYWFVLFKKELKRQGQHSALKK